MSSLQSDVVGFLIDSIPGAAQIYKKQVGRQIITQSEVKQGGKISGWAQDIGNSMQIGQVSYSNGVITAQIYIPQGNNEARANVLMHGNFGIGDPPMTKPGQETWDDNMIRKSVHVSGDKEARQMPEKFLRDPMITWQFLQNAGKKCDKNIHDYFSDVSQDILFMIDKLVRQLAGSGK